MWEKIVDTFVGKALDKLLKGKTPKHLVRNWQKRLLSYTSLLKIVTKLGKPTTLKSGG